MNLRRLNGWQRAWVMVTIIWVVPLSFVAIGKPVLFFLFTVVAPPIVLYAHGLAVAWLIRGLRGEELK